MIDISANEIQSYFFKNNSNDFDILRVKTNYDMQKLKKNIAEIIDKAGFRNKDKSERSNEDYAGIGLQYADEADPIYDAVDQIAYIPEEGPVKYYRTPRILYKKNEFGEKLSYLYKPLDQLQLFRGRILNARPNIKMPSHTDGLHIYNCHVPVFTNPKCLIHINRKPYHLEADGSFYIINAQKPHHISNQSEEDRIHVIFTLSFFSFKNWSKDIIDRSLVELNIKDPVYIEKTYNHNGLHYPSGEMLNKING